MKETCLLFESDILIKSFSRSYGESFGANKFNTILAILERSKNLSKLVRESLSRRIIPGHSDFLSTLNTIPYFIFSKAETLAFGAVVSIQHWHDVYTEKGLEIPEEKFRNLIVNALLAAYNTKIKSTNRNKFFEEYFGMLKKISTDAINSMVDRIEEEYDFKFPPNERQELIGILMMMDKYQYNRIEKFCLKTEFENKEVLKRMVKYNNASNAATHGLDFWMSV